MKFLGTLAALGMAAAPALSAQATYAQFTGEARNTVVVQDDASGGGINNPLYLPPATDNNYSGVVNLWFRDAGGVVRGACTGSLLATRKILTAGHCVSTGTNAITWSSFTARFRNADGTFTEVNGTGFAVQQNYSGAVIEEQDVAVLTLSADAPAGARTYSLFAGNPLVDYTLAGFGRTGTGLTGDGNTANNQFGAVNVLRAASNRFETTGRDGGSFATSANPTPGGFGGVLLSDFDPLGGSATSFMCSGLGFCDNGRALLEGAVGRGDSGGSAFTSGFEDLSVSHRGARAPERRRTRCSTRTVPCSVMPASRTSPATSAASRTTTS
ncbi:MAG: trypsin-like serine protease [Gemmatimonadaceae bacterium]|nr:trypsin-like serine protease [Gemmatimonadaceae bacterium]